MKFNRKSILILFIFLFFSGKAYSYGGIGLAVGEPSGLSLRFNNFPVITVGWSWYNRIMGSVDYWFINNKIETTGPILRWYVGAGAFAGLYTGTYSNKNVIVDSPLLIGARVPIGLLYYPVRNIEIFLEGAPALRILPGLTFDWQAALGIRFMIFK